MLDHWLHKLKEQYLDEDVTHADLCRIIDQAGTIGYNYGSKRRFQKKLALLLARNTKIHTEKKELQMEINRLKDIEAKYITSRTTNRALRNKIKLLRDF